MIYRSLVVPLEIQTCERTQLIQKSDLYLTTGARKSSSKIRATHLSPAQIADAQKLEPYKWLFFNQLGLRLFLNRDR